MVSGWIWKAPKAAVAEPVVLPLVLPEGDAESDSRLHGDCVEKMLAVDDT